MQLHLVRHGQTRWNAERRVQGQLDSALDAIGRAQARALAPTLDALDIGAVYCSTSGRARETLALATGAPPADVVYRDELREICLGVWQGRLWAEIERESPAMVESLREALPDFAVDGAESYVALRERGVRAIERIVAERAAEVVLVVSHGALLKSVLAHYAGCPITAQRALPSLPNCAHSTLHADGTARTLTLVAGEPVGGSPWERRAPTGPLSTDSATPPA